MDSATQWNDTAPDASNFTVGTGTFVNTNTDEYIAHLFASVDGLVKVGSYVGNANADGPFAYCGFRPAALLFKVNNVTRNWGALDIASYPLNLGTGVYYWFPDVSNAAAARGPSSGTDWNVHLLANSFKVRGIDGAQNNSGSTIIFVAFAESPFKYSRAR